MSRWVLSADETRSETSVERVGSKVAGLTQLHQLGLRVPPGFTLLATAGDALRARGADPRARHDIRTEVETAYRTLGLEPGRKVAVRSSPARSMPGMLSTQLHVTPNNLWPAIERVAQSWWDAPAVRYRAREEIPDDSPLAIHVQGMVDGSRGTGSGSGIVFSRNPTSGAPGIHGEFVPDASGSAVSSGEVVPQAIDQLLTVAPAVHRELAAAAAKVERHLRSVQELEFTFEEGTLYFLQTRAAPCTAAASVRFVIESVEHAWMSKREALRQLDVTALSHLVEWRIPPPVGPAQNDRKPLAKGLPASPGAVTGQLQTDRTQAKVLAGEGQRVIFAAPSIGAEDVETIRSIDGLITATGGLTSHAAVIARALGCAAVTGCETMHFDRKGRAISFGRTGSDPVAVPDGSWLTIDGTRGEVYLGDLKLTLAPRSPEFPILLAWVRELTDPARPPAGEPWATLWRMAQDEPGKR